VIRVALAILLVLGACASHDGTGNARVSVAINALTASDVTSVRVTVSAPDITTPIVSNLVLAGGAWESTITQIPGGTGRVFSGEARDGDGTVIFTGSAMGVTITDGGTAVVMIVMHEAMPPDPFHNTAPYLTSFVLSSDHAAPGEGVTAVAQAVDLDGEPLTWGWTGTGGSFSPIDQQATTWTAPPADGTYGLTIAVRDPHGATDMLTALIDVITPIHEGRADVTVTLDLAPRISQISSTLGHIRVGGDPVVLAVSATDVEPGPLTYRWTSSCAGDGTDPAAPAFAFQLTDLLASDCTIGVTVTDSAGNTAYGDVVLHVSADPAPDLAPVIDATAGGSTAYHAERVTFTVVAHDPEGSALSFSWSAITGSFSTPNETASSSDIEWTAPDCFTGTADILVVISDAAGNSTEQSFVVTAEAQQCTPSGLVAWWTGDGALDQVSGRSLAGSASYTAGRHGLAFAFNGGTQLAAPATGLPVAGAARTLELWARVDSSVAIEEFYCGWGGFGSVTRSFALGSSSLRPFVSIWGPGVSSASTIATGAWHHLATTYSGGTYVLYVDGVVVGSGSVSPDTGAGSVLLGYLDVNRRLVGALDDVRIYDRALSAAEIAELAAH